MKHLPQIFIESIPHNEQRYDTCGDYFKTKDPYLRKTLQFFTISESKADYEFLILMHEMTEWYLTEKNGILEKDITKFDKTYEKARTKGIKAPCGCKPTKDSEPGNDKHAPYNKEHIFATKIEKILAKQISVGWSDYNKNIDNLCTQRN